MIFCPLCLNCVQTSDQGLHGQSPAAGRVGSAVDQEHLHGLGGTADPATSRLVTVLAAYWIRLARDLPARFGEAARGSRSVSMILHGYRVVTRAC